MLRIPTVSRFHLELRRAEDRIVALDHGSTNGTLIGPVLVDGGAVSVLPGALLKLGNSSFRVDDGRLVSVEPGSDSVGELRGQSTVMRRLMASIERVARTDVPVSIVGESGTGKELVARAIHDLGPRRAEPFVTVDCAAIAPTLFASELFGHERGAFTGAERQHIGAFERAGGGSCSSMKSATLRHSYSPHCSECWSAGDFSVSAAPRDRSRRARRFRDAPRSAARR